MVRGDNNLNETDMERNEEEVSGKMRTWIAVGSIVGIILLSELIKWLSS
jgi:hypothetical protein